MSWQDFINGVEQRYDKFDFNSFSDEYTEKAIQAQLEKKVDKLGIDQRAHHRSPLREYREAGGLGIPKLVGFDPIVLRAFARQNSIVSSAIDIRCREVSSAAWDVVPDLEDWDREAALLRKLIRSIRQDPTRILKTFTHRAIYMEPGEARAILEATRSNELSDAEVKERFEHARLDRTITAEFNASKVRNLIANCNRNPMTNWRQLQRALITDFLTIGTLSLEKRRLKLPKGKDGWPKPDNDLAELHYVDSATVRPCFDEHGILRGQNAGQEGELAFEQWIDGRPVEGGGWRYCDLVWNVIAPQTDIEFLGYGISPTEALVVTMMLDAWGDKEMLEEFKRGTKGVALAFKGPQFSHQMMRYEREMYEQEIEGTQRTAMFGLGEDGDLKSIPLQSHTGAQDKRSVEMRNLFETRVAARFQMPKAKLTGDAKGDARATTDNQKDWDDDGLASLLLQWDETMNHGVVRDMGHNDVKYVSRPGHGREDEAKIEATEKKLRAGIYYTINEARVEEWDLEPVEDGDVSIYEFEERGRALGQQAGMPDDGMGMDEGFEEEAGPEQESEEGEAEGGDAQEGGSFGSSDNNEQSSAQEEDQELVS